jgi:hypothetical protein
MSRRVKLEIQLEDDEVEYIKLDMGVTSGITSEQLEQWLFETIQMELGARDIPGSQEDSERARRSDV